VTSALNELEDGETTQVKGSGSNLYTLRNIAGVYSCTCPAWMHQGLAIERRTCKHLRAFRGDAAETERTGSTALQGKPVRTARPPKSGDDDEPDAPGGGAPPPLLLAHKWEMDVELSGWWMSEKLDGVRAYWDGSSFISRLGNAFHAPAWFTASLPKTPLDGELWGGRKKFQRTVGIVKRQDKSDAWKEIRYLVFDAPAHPGGFEARLAHCKQLLAAKNEWAEVHHHEPCRDMDHLREQMAHVESLGGEGLMMRKPGSPYVHGRSDTLLKVKSFHDAEARVVEHSPGTGRHKGRLGALVVELPDGTTFNVGTGFSDQERDEPPPVGAVVTFRYQELSDGGVPRFPSYVGVRIDLDWKTVKAQAGTAHKKVHGVPQKRGTTGAHAAVKRAEVAPVAPPRPARKGRYFEFVEGESSKFWEIAVEGAQFTVRYGKVGSAGQTTLKEFESPEAAAREAEKLVSEKTRKGYVEQTGPGREGEAW
jgi:DNA ligase 1